MASGRWDRLWWKPAPEDLVDIMDTFHEMAYATREQAATANRMIESLERHVEGNLDENAGGTEVILEYLKFIEFRKANPPNV